MASLLSRTDKTSRNDRVFATGSEEVKGDKPSQKTNPRTQIRSPPVVMPQTPMVDSTEPRVCKGPLQINKVFSQHERRLLLLQRDRDIYDEQNQKMMKQIMGLTTQLEDAKAEASKCRE